MPFCTIVAFCIGTASMGSLVVSYIPKHQRCSKQPDDEFIPYGKLNYFIQHNYFR
ncbi:MAG: hypothetical protein IPI36_07105 [Chitinophagaceae bacterium]|nr:hypothetical protein [Chitinophagaceae bacterium]